MTLEIRWSDKYENYVNWIFNLQLKKSQTNQSRVWEFQGHLDHFFHQQC